MGGGVSTAKKKSKEKNKQTPAAEPIEEPGKGKTFKSKLPLAPQETSNPNRRAKKSVVVGALNDGKLKEFQAMIETRSKTNDLESIKEETISQTEFTKFKIQIPAGVEPGGTFTAVCNGLIFILGDFLEIDLTEPLENEDEDLVLSEDELEITKKAAILFVKYNKKKCNEDDKTLNDDSVDLPELKRMLILEFQFEPGSKQLETEMKLAGGSLMFEDFRFYYSQLIIRLDFYKHEKQAKEKLKEMSDKKQNIYVSYNEEPREEEKKKVVEEDSKENDFQKQIENLRQEFELRTQKYEKEIKTLKQRKSSIRKRKQTLSIKSIEYANLEKVEKKKEEQEAYLVEQKKKNEEMIKEIMSDFRDMTNAREKSKEDQKQKMKQKVEEKRKLRATLLEEEKKNEETKHSEKNKAPEILQKPLKSALKKTKSCSSGLGFEFDEGEGFKFAGTHSKERKKTLSKSVSFAEVEFEQDHPKFDRKATGFQSSLLNEDEGKVDSKPKRSPRISGYVEAKKNYTSLS
eukprot:snap_masked-scaffold_9-processed-gene-9.33-mRNA-1 protein AED:1.00 eAED:1.00 QI:0/0/0/0/1/1/4/0/515